MQDALGAVQSVLVLGGGSEIALATVRRLADARTQTVVLAARKPEALAAAVHELRERGITTVEAIEFDATALERHEAFVDDVFDRFGDFDVVLVAFGVLGDQTEAERYGTTATDIASVNYLGAMSIAIPIAQRLRTQGHGAIVALSSVAGERARRSNFVYGSSKAGMDAFFQGLGDSLVGTGVHVMVVRPGFVHTQDDRRTRACTAVDHARGGRRRHRARARSARRHGVGAIDPSLCDVGASPRAAAAVPQAPAVTGATRTVAAFDFDKTLSTRDNVLAFLRFRCRHETARHGARNRLAAPRRGRHRRSATRRREGQGPPRASRGA